VNVPVCACARVSVCTVELCLFLQNMILFIGLFSKRDLHGRVVFRRNMCVYVCVRDRERERACVCGWESCVLRTRKYVSLYMRGRERESVGVWVWVWMLVCERGGFVCVFVWVSACVCACVCVCVSGWVSVRL